MYEFTYAHVYKCVYVYTIAQTTTHTHSGIYIKICDFLDD